MTRELAHPVFHATDDRSGDRPIGYMERTRVYYGALGYAPYRWAHYRDVPFQRLARPLRQSKVALVTTAAPDRPERGDSGRGDPGRNTYDAAAKFFQVYSGDSAPAAPLPDLRINHVAIDFTHTTGEDLGSFFPLAALRKAAQSGRIGAVGPRFHGVPTNRSQRVTLETDVPDLLARCRQDGAEAAILVPNCPVCHQTMSLAARMLEANGIATIVMGSAKDIVEHAGVPRFLFSDFPLGNAAGKPNDAASQEFTLGLALDVLESAVAARTTVQSPLRWSEDAGWKRDYGNVAGLSEGEIAGLKAEFEKGKDVAKGIAMKRG